MRSLKNQTEFDLVNKKGSKIHSPYFILVRAANLRLPKITTQINSSTNFLFGMKVGKKLGGAVIRNKIKRRIRHIMHLVIKLPEIAAKHLALIIIPRRGFEKIEFSLLLESFEKALLK